MPRSWADPDYQGEGTRILSAEDMRAMAAGGGNVPATPGEAPAPMHIEGAHLVILAGPAAGMGFPLDDAQTEWTIGTAEERDIRLEFSGVSAFHAKISQDGGRWRIIDQMSANGTWVNGQKSTISYLQDGDKLRFAQVECEIRIPGGSRAARKGARNSASGASSGGATRMIVIGVVVAGITGAALWLASQFL
ncbi:MAG: FHA domain-containing protein [Gammaproteobacteria bacterium]